MCKVKQLTEIVKLQDTEESSDSEDDSDNSQEDESEEMTDTDEPHYPPIPPERIKKIDMDLMVFSIKTYQPVESVRLTQFTNSVNVAYVMSKRKGLLKELLPKMFQKCLEEQKIFVQQNAESVCLTLDRWESPNKEPVMSVTAHFITSGFELKSVLLKVHHCQLNAENLKRVLMETCTEWGISDKVKCCVSNNMGRIAHDVWTAPAINSLGWDHIDCVGYKLHTALYNSLHLCDKIILRVNNILSYFRSSRTSRRKMEKYRVKECVTEALDFFYLDGMNWYRRYDMLERFVQSKNCLEAILAVQRDIPLAPITNEGWTQLEQILKCLKPFNKVVKEMVDDKYVSASKVIPIVNGLKQELHKTPECYYLVRDLIYSLDREMNEQFNGIESNPNLAMCTILDPRYKTSMFLDKNAEDRAKFNLVSEVEALVKVTHGPTGSVTSFDTLSMAIDDEVDLSLLNQTVNRRLAQKEVEFYLLEELTDEDKALPPCTWWLNNKFKFPHVAKLFQIRCNNIATSIPTHFIFTEMGIEIYRRRNTVDLTKSAMILFLNQNVKGEDYIRLMPESYHSVMDQS